VVNNNICNYFGNQQFLVDYQPFNQNEILNVNCLSSIRFVKDIYGNCDLNTKLVGIPYYYLRNPSLPLTSAMNSIGGFVDAQLIEAFSISTPIMYSGEKYSMSFDFGASISELNFNNGIDTSNFQPFEISIYLVRCQDYQFSRLCQPSLRDTSDLSSMYPIGCIKVLHPTTKWETSAFFFDVNNNDFNSIIFTTKIIGGSSFNNYTNWQIANVQVQKLTNRELIDTSYNLSLNCKRVLKSRDSVCTQPGFVYELIRINDTGIIATNTVPYFEIPALSDESLKVRMRLGDYISFNNECSNSSYYDMFLTSSSTVGCTNCNDVNVLKIEDASVSYFSSRYQRITSSGGLASMWTTQRLYSCSENYICNNDNELQEFYFRSNLTQGNRWRVTLDSGILGVFLNNIECDTCQTLKFNITNHPWAMYRVSVELFNTTTNESKTLAINLGLPGLNALGIVSSLVNHPINGLQMPVELSVQHLNGFIINNYSCEWFFPPGTQVVDSSINDLKVYVDASNFSNLSFDVSITDNATGCSVRKRFSVLNNVFNIEGLRSLDSSLISKKYVFSSSVGTSISKSCNSFIRNSVVYDYLELNKSFEEWVIYDYSGRRILGGVNSNGIIFLGTNIYKGLYLVRVRDGRRWCSQSFYKH
jgi:hypothetical protein